MFCFSHEGEDDVIVKGEGIGCNRFCSRSFFTDGISTWMSFSTFVQPVGVSELNVHFLCLMN
jgi:hypothetical protein